MKIMTFNIRQGGGTRVPVIIESIKSHNATTVILTEFRNNKNSKSIQREMSKLGYRYFSCINAEPRKNTVCIFSKEHFSTRFFNDELGSHSHRLIEADFGKIKVLGVYFAQRNEKKVLFEYLLNLQSTTALIIGDFNTGLPEHDQENGTFYCHELFKKLYEKYVDCWRAINPSLKEYTWYSNAGNGFRIDHALCSKDISNNVTNAYYSHEERESKVSDHSALLLEVNIS